MEGKGNGGKELERERGKKKGDGTVIPSQAANMRQSLI